MSIKRCRTRIAVIVLSFLLPACAFSLDANSVSPASAPGVKSEAVTNADEVLRTYLQLQAQIHEAQQAIERTRQEADHATATNAAALSNRLHAIERALSEQRSNDQDTVRNTNQAMLVIAGTFVSVGLVAMLLTAYMHWRAVNRLAEIASALPASHAAASYPLTAIGMGENPILSGGAAETSARLLGTIELLERRIHELERHEPPNGHAIIPGNGGPASSATARPVIETTSEVSRPPSSSDPSARAAMLLGKGQSLLNLDNKAEEALACFDEALALDADNTDALVKKGAALEKLRKPQEAIECYDRALALDDSLTIAYLHKGGLFNRMERFSEAMQCYEQALRTQEKRRAA
jgi:tetratricopeptide (TPR) repeat protein